MSDHSLYVLFNSSRSRRSGRGCFTWLQIPWSIVAICGGGQAMALPTKFLFIALFGAAWSMLFSISPSFPARADVTCIKEIAGSANPPVQADDNFDCLKKALSSLQEENKNLQKRLSTTARVEVGTCVYAQHDAWDCAATCAQDETAVGGWCGNMDQTEATTDWFYIGGHKTFTCSLHQHVTDMKPPLLSVSAICLRPHGG